MRPVLGTGQAYCGYLFHFSSVGPLSLGGGRDRYSYICVSSMSPGSYYLNYSESTGSFSFPLSLCDAYSYDVTESSPDLSSACFSGLAHPHSCVRSWGTSKCAVVQPYPDINEAWGEYTITGM